MTTRTAEQDGGERERATAPPATADVPPAETGTGAWADADFATTTSAVFPTAWEQTDFWMVHKHSLKTPFAPWGEKNPAGVPCEKPACAGHFDRDADDSGFDADCDACRQHRDGDAMLAECGHDPRWKWGRRGNWAAKATADEWVELDPEIAGHIAVLSEDDPFLFVDGDDVRDPATGEVHPDFRALLDHLGRSYADVSTSGSGVHALYVGALPDGVKQGNFALDTEPWGANDEVPGVEIYDSGRVCVATGEHVAGTPAEVRAVDADALADILAEHDPALPDDPADFDADATGATSAYEVGHDTDRERANLTDHTPTATANDETTDDVRDVLAAVDALDPSDLPLRTRQVGHDATGWEQWDPSPYRASAGGDSLHRPPDDAVFHDHKRGQSFGVLSLFAAEQGIIARPWDDLSGDDWWTAVEQARDHGAPIPKYEGGGGGRGRGDPERVAVLPDTPAGREWWRADTRDAETSADELSQETVRERTKQAIADAYERREDALVEAMPAAGKSYGAIAAAAETGEPITFLTGRGHKEQYEQVREWCEEHGLRSRRLPSFQRHCDTANGEHGDEWAATVNRWYRRGATPKQIHAHAETHLGEPLPCQRHDGQQCRFTSLWDFDPDDYDVLIGHYTHAHVPSVVNGRTVVLDEFPDAFETTLTSRLQPAVSCWLSQHDAIPYDDYTDLIEHRDDDQRRATTLDWFLNGDGDLDTAASQRDVFEDENAHAAAPLAVFALLTGDDLGNGFERADLRDAGVAARSRETGALTLLRPPSFEHARGVVGLDGTPTPVMWETALGTSLTHREVLDDAERAQFLRGLDLTVVQTTDAIKSYSAGESAIHDRVSLAEDTALLEAVADQHGDQPGVITTNRAEGVYEEAGVFDAHADANIHYGNVLGSNTFANKRVGAVLGSRNFGPDFVKKWCAYLGETTDPTFPSAENDFAPTDYGPVGNKIRTHTREHETLQAAMRFGRDGDGAVVFVHTNTLPDWVPREHGEVVQTWSDGMRQVLDAASDRGEWTTKDLCEHPAVDLSRQQVFAHLETLHDRGLLAREQDPADGRRYLWGDDGLHRVGQNGAVELPTVELDALSAGEVRKVARITTYRWRFTNSPASAPARRGASAVVAENGGGRAASGGPPVPTGD
jgi:hypothetical protein